MKIQRLIAVLGKLVDKEPEQRRLAHAGCSEDQGDFACCSKNLSGQGLLHAGSRCSHWTGGFSAKKDGR